MPGISAIGAYVPKYRLARSLFAQAWGSGGGPGERAVASYDEDTLSLAVNAAVDAINAHGRDGIDAVYFASTTAPYREKSSAALVTAAADLGTNIRTADFGGFAAVRSHGPPRRHRRRQRRVGELRAGRRLRHPPRLPQVAFRVDVRGRRRRHCRDGDRRRGDRRFRHQHQRDGRRVAARIRRLRALLGRPVRDHPGLRNGDQGRGQRSARQERACHRRCLHRRGSTGPTSATTRR